MIRPVYLLLVLGGLATATGGPEPGVFRADFRGKPIDVELFELYRADDQVRTEPEGLRVTLDGSRKGERGLRANFRVKGDFEFTISYELVTAEPAQAPRVGVTLYVKTEDVENAMMLGRFNYPGGKSAYHTSMGAWVNGKRQFSGHGHPTTTKTGRLRMVRHGAELTCLAADTFDDDFIEIERRPDFGAEDLNFIRIAAQENGWPDAVLDARFLELEIRSPQSFGPDGTPLFPQFAGAKSSSRAPDGTPLVALDKSRRWLVAAEILGVIVLVLVLGLWRWRRSRNRGETAGRNLHVGPPGGET